MHLIPQALVFMMTAIRVMTRLLFYLPFVYYISNLFYIEDRHVLNVSIYPCYILMIGLFHFFSHTFVVYSFRQRPR